MSFPHPKFLLRWRFEWADRPAKYGLWSHPGSKEDLATKAWCNNKSGLMYAIVEAKDFLTREVRQVLRCPGQDFVNFQWIALAFSPAIGLKGSVTPITRVGGLKVITRDEEISVLDCGKVTREPVTTGNINFATFGK